MKYLLKWMNNCEKELLSSCEPLYNYAQWVRNASYEIGNIIDEGFKSGELKTNQEAWDKLSKYPDFKRREGLEYMKKQSLYEDPDSGVNSHDFIVKYAVLAIEEYCRTYLPPSLLTLSSPPNGPDLLKSSTSIKDTLEIMHILIANIVAFPNNFNEIIQELATTMEECTPHMGDLSKEILAYVEPYLESILKQSVEETPAALTNTKWGLKALTTYFFLKHSHKIQLTEVVQKMFEMTDISDKVDISKGLKLPYPMNYIEFNKSLPIVMSNEKTYEITGALMYEVHTGESLNAVIGDFPKEGHQFLATIHGMVGLDQVKSTRENGYKNTRLSYDKALFPLGITKVDKEIVDENTTLKGSEIVLGMHKHPLNDSALTYLMGIPKNDLPLLNEHYAENEKHVYNSEWRTTTLNDLLAANWEHMLSVGYGKLSFQCHGIMQRIADLGVLGANHVQDMVIDPLYKYDEEKIAHNIKAESYTVVELVINYGKYDEQDQALWSNIGPYIEIGRREGGDLWETVKEAFKDTMNGENASEGNKSQFLEAFKTALQSIWFINEPNVKLKEASEEQPSKRRQYFPKTKVTNRRKIVLRGEISRYLNSLRKTVGRSPKGAWWVRGHWRNQWYPSIQGNKRKWIRPYVKGTGKATKKQVDLDPNTEV